MAILQELGCKEDCSDSRKLPWELNGWRKDICSFEVASWHPDASHQAPDTFSYHCANNSWRYWWTKSKCNQPQILFDITKPTTLTCSRTSVISTCWKTTSIWSVGDVPWIEQDQCKENHWPWWRSKQTSQGFCMWTQYSHHWYIQFIVERKQTSTNL